MNSKCSVSALQRTAAWGAGLTSVLFLASSVRWLCLIACGKLRHEHRMTTVSFCLCESGKAYLSWIYAKSNFQLELHNMCSCSLWASKEAVVSLN